MTGSSTDLIFIIIVPTICLAVWLVIVYHSSSHPEWRRDRTPAQNMALGVGQDENLAGLPGNVRPEPHTAAAGSVSRAESRPEG